MDDKLTLLMLMAEQGISFAMKFTKRDYNSWPETQGYLWDKFEKGIINVVKMGVEAYYSKSDENPRIILQDACESAKTILSKDLEDNFHTTAYNQKEITDTFDKYYNRFIDEVINHYLNQ